MTASPALVSTIRATSSFLLEDDILELLRGDLTAVTLPKLKELARIFEIPNGQRKAELVVNLHSKIKSLATQPLTHEALKREAQRKEITTAWFSYRDLRYLLGYDKVTSAGIVYIDAVTNRTIPAILLGTIPGTALRLYRLKQALNDVTVIAEWEEWNSGVLTVEPMVYRLLFTRDVALTEQNRYTRLIYTNLSSDIGSTLLSTMPDSLDRRRLLNTYDPTLMTAFRQRHDLSAEQDLNLLVAVDAISRSPNAAFYYVNDKNPITRALAFTRENSLERYVAVKALDYELELLCAIPRLEDNRPHKIRDYSPAELDDVPTELLQSLALKEGLYPIDVNPPVDRDLLIEQLEIAHVSPTFYRTDIIENTDQAETCLLTPLDEVRTGHLYAYGIRDGTGKYAYYEREELKLRFASEKDFIDPITNKTFDLTAIRRLYVLALGDGTEGSQDFRNCLHDVLRVTSAVTSEELQIVNELRKCSAVKQCLELLFEGSLFMRKWDGNHDKYPLRADETEEKIEEELLFARIHDSLLRFRTAVDDLDEPYKEKFWNLRLKFFKREGFISSTEDVDGYTIRDRFNIVYQGNHPDSPLSSCVRLTSGWFVFTSLYYYQLIYRENLHGVRAHEIDEIS